jgi:type II secretory pathway predicted ATPase ExeA
MIDAARQAEPFAATADAASYVPRRATETALEALEWALRSGRRTLVMTGPAGIGKTTLLRVLQRRLGNDFRSIYAPYAALPADELCAWLLGLLDEKSQGDPEEELLAFARESATRCHGLVAAIDDAGSIPLATARRLTALVARAEGALRMILVCGDEDPAESIYPALGPVFEEIRVEEPLCLDEAIHYIDRRLERAQAPESVRARFVPDTVRTLHRQSRGIPGVLHQLASEVVRGRLPEHGAEPGAGARVEDVSWHDAPPVVAWEAGDDEEDYDREVPPELLRARSRLRRLQAPPRTLLIAGAALLIALAAAVLPWLRPTLLPPQPLEGIPEPQAPQEPAVQPSVAWPEVAPPSLEPAPPLPAPREEVAEVVPQPVAEVVPSEAAGVGGAPLDEVPSAPPTPSQTAAPAPAPAAEGATPAFIAVSINATPWARIAVDGVLVGETPLADLPLVPGPHTITATLPSGQIFERTVEVSAESRHFAFGP